MDPQGNVTFINAGTLLRRGHYLVELRAAILMRMAVRSTTIARRCIATDDKHRMQECNLNVVNLSVWLAKAAIPTTNAGQVLAALPIAIANDHQAATPTEVAQQFVMVIANHSPSNANPTHAAQAKFV
jgi:hypothetical protein